MITWAILLYANVKTQISLVIIYKLTLLMLRSLEDFRDLQSGDSLLFGLFHYLFFLLTHVIGGVDGKVKWSQGFLHLKWRLNDKLISKLTSVKGV